MRQITCILLLLLIHSVLAASEPKEAQTLVNDTLKSYLEKGDASGFGRARTLSDPSSAAILFLSEARKVPSQSSRAAIISQAIDLDLFVSERALNEHGQMSDGVRRELIKYVSEDSDKQVRSLAAKYLVDASSPEKLDRYGDDIKKGCVKWKDNVDTNIILLFGRVQCTSINDIIEFAESTGLKEKNPLGLAAVLAYKGDLEAENTIIRELERCSGGGSNYLEHLLRLVDYANTVTLRKKVAQRIVLQETYNYDDFGPIPKGCVFLWALLRMMRNEPSFPVNIWSTCSDAEKFEKAKQWCEKNWKISYPKTEVKEWYCTPPARF